MYKLLMDSDALIKISKAGFLDMLAEEFDVITTEEIYDETVKEGKKRFYPDADKIENLVKNNRIKVLNGKYYRKNKKPKQSFGKGEASLYQAYKKSTLIVSDDLSFWSYIQNENLKIISSAHLISVLVKKNIIKKEDAYNCLEKMKPFIRKEVHDIVKKDIQGG